MELNVVWVDPNINSDQNTKFANTLKNINHLKLYTFKNIDEAINQMKNFYFVETKVIISGKLYSNFVKSFKENINIFCIIPKIIVFTGNKDKFIQYNNDYQNNDNKFYAFGGIGTKFSEIKNFLTNNNIPTISSSSSDDSNNSTNNDKIQFIFEYIDSKEKLELPLIYESLLNSITNENIEEYNNYLYNIYSNEKNGIKSLLLQIKSIPNIPIELLSKYYMKE